MLRNCHGDGFFRNIKILHFLSPPVIQSIWSLVLLRIEYLTLIRGAHPGTYSPEPGHPAFPRTGNGRFSDTGSPAGAFSGNGSRQLLRPTDTTQLTHITKLNVKQNMWLKHFIIVHCGCHTFSDRCICICGCLIMDCTSNCLICKKSHKMSWKFLWKQLIFGKHRLTLIFTLDFCFEYLWILFDENILKKLV